MEFTYTIVDPQGLHARPASLLVKEAQKYPNKIEIKHKDRIVSLKSILLVMTLGIPKGDSFTITIDGDSPETINDAFKEILENDNLI